MCSRDSSKVQSSRRSAMTNERDDTAGLRRSGESASDPVEDRCRRAAADAGILLITQYGMRQDVVTNLCDEAMRSWRTFRRDLRDPDRWVHERIIERAKAYRERHGVDADAEEKPLHISDAIRDRAALNTLPPRARKALRMLCFEQKSFEEIAEELDVCVPAARGLVTKGLNRLRRWRPRPEEREE